MAAILSGEAGTIVTPNGRYDAVASINTTTSSLHVAAG